MRRLNHLELVWTNTNQGIRSEYKKRKREQSYWEELYGPYLRFEKTCRCSVCISQLICLMIISVFQSGDSHVLRIFDEESQAMESVRRSSRLLEDSYATGVAILSKYSEQRDHLKVLIHHLNVNSVIFLLF